MKPLLLFIFFSATIFTYGQNLALTDLRKGSTFLIKFGKGSSRLDSSAVKDLDVVVKGFSIYPGLRMEIAGHTDFKGDPKQNSRLSTSRAEAVKNYFIAKGVNKKQINAVDFGGTQPLSKELPEMNRRVELMVLENPTLPRNFFSANQKNQNSAEEIQATEATKQDSSFTKLKKVALVIGNADYIKSPKLKNPTNDARLMTTTLTSLGFSVSTHVNLSYTDMIKAIKDFSYVLNGADIVLVYFAGHGMQFNGENYLLPVDITLKNGANDLPFEGINSTIILRILEYTNKESLNMIILDACRSIPFSNGTRGAGEGLAEIKPPTGTIIAFATSPGSVAFDGEGENGVYTTELVRQMNKAQRVEDLFMQTRLGVEKVTAGRQSPWELVRLRGIFYFKK
jgi:hypothetical protein